MVALQFGPQRTFGHAVTRLVGDLDAEPQHAGVGDVGLDQAAQVKLGLIVFLGTVIQDRQIFIDLEIGRIIGKARA